jgi:N-acylneuraminate cytidylyltransferase/CMP-N,N'-diacetyllegionaminic acid synthase
MIAIIPARGNSKGLPGKNIKYFHGKPLIAHTIEAALNSTSVSRVIVSTDNAEIANISKAYGAEIPFMRPGYLATDEAMAIDTYIYTIDRISREEKISIEDIIVLLPTAPLRNASDIDEAVEIYKNNTADSVISYTKEAHPVFWHKYIDDKGRFVSLFDENILNNRQELRETFYPNGAIFIFKTVLLRTGKYYGDNSLSYIMPGNRSVDIDTIEDFNYAEYLMRQSHGE